MPEQFWDDKGGGLKQQEFGSHYAELSGFHKDHTARLAEIPAKAEDYPLDLPADFKRPEGFDYALDPKDPMVAAARDWALENKLTKPAFQSLVALKAKIDAAEVENFNAAVARQKKELGPDHAARVQALGRQLSAAIGDDGLTQAIMGTLFTAKQVLAFERLMQNVNHQGVVPINGSIHAPQVQPTPAQMPIEQRWYGTPPQRTN